MAPVRGPDHRVYHSDGRIHRPMGVRILHGSVALVSLAVLAFAVWIGVRSPDAPQTVVADTLTTTSAASTSTAAPTGSAPVTVATTAPSTSASTVVVTTAAATTTEAAPAAPSGVTFAALRGAAVLAAAPGGNGTMLAADARVGLSGRFQVVNGSTWYEVDTGAETGWTPAVALDVDGSGFATRPCGEIPAELPPTALAYQPGTVEGSADGIVGFERHRSPECERVVLYLGEGLATGDGRFASSFPPGLSIIDVSGRVRVEMEGGVAVVPELGYLTLPIGESEAIALIAHRPDGSLAYNLDAGPARLAVSFLARPARVVLDMNRVGSAAPGIGNGVVVNGQTMADALLSGDGRPILVSGFARLPDGLGEIAFRRAPSEGADPGSGLALDAQFDGTSRAGSVFRSWYFYETPRVDGDWAEFRFTVSGLEPGRYEMFLGLGASPPPDVTDPGLHQVLEVAAVG